MSTSSDASRSGLKSGCDSSIPIIVGTITVIVTWCCSMASRTDLGSNIGTNVDVPPLAGMPRMPPIDAAWNIGVWCRYTKSSSRPPANGDVVHVQHLGPLVEQHALGQPGGAARVHEDDRVVLLGLVGHVRLARRDQVLVREVVGDVALADEHDLLDRPPPCARRR